MYCRSSLQRHNTDRVRPCQGISPTHIAIPFIVVNEDEPCRQMHPPKSPSDLCGLCGSAVQTQGAVLASRTVREPRPKLGAANSRLSYPCSRLVYPLGS